MERGRLTFASAVAKRIPIMLYRNTRLAGKVLVQTNTILYDSNSMPVQSSPSNYAELEHAKQAAKACNLRLVKA